VEVIWEHDPGLYGERVAATRDPDGLPQSTDVANEEVVAATLKQG
jgi:hypothetical protein